MSDGLKLIAKLLEEGAVTGLRELNREMFIDEEADAYSYVRNHYRRYGELPDIETVEEDVGCEFPLTPENAEYYREKVADRHMYNSLREPFNQLRLALSDMDKDRAKSAVSALQSTVRETSAVQDIRNINELAAGRLEHATDVLGSMTSHGITTGWDDMDTRIGGYQNGDLITWVARPGMGKTYYLLHQALAAYRAGHSVLFVSMEMSLNQLGNRLMGMVTGFNPRAIRDGMLSNRMRPRFASRVQEFQDESNNGIFHLYAGNFHKNVEDVEQLVLELSPDILYIDGVYLMTTDTGFKRGGRYEGAADVFDYLKRMTIVHDRPIVVTTKFAKGAGKGGQEGSLENIGYTDTVGTHSSLVVALKEGEAPHQLTRRNADILKGREGEEGTFQYYFLFTPMNFGEIDINDPLDGAGGNGNATRLRREGNAVPQGWTSNHEGED